MIIYQITREEIFSALEQAPKFGNRNEWNLMSGPLGEMKVQDFLQAKGQRVDRVKGNAHDLEIYLSNRWIHVEVKTRSSGRSIPTPERHVLVSAARVFRQANESDLFVFAWRWHENGDHFLALLGWEYSRDVKRWTLFKKGTKWDDADDLCQYDVLRQRISHLRPMSELIKKLDDETV